MSLLLLRIIAAGLVVALLGTSSCSVYAPLQPSAPLLRDKGQAEVTGSLYLSGRLEGSVAYSPVKHVLVRAAGGLKPQQGDSTHFRIRQGEVGAGTYRALSEHWLVGGLGGYGIGRSSRRFTENDFRFSSFDTTITTHYQARFHKVYGEVFVAYEGEWITLGGAYRLSQVRFTSLTNNSLPINLRRMVRSEPMVFMRFGNPQGPLRWMQLQVAISLSTPPGSGTTSQPYVSDITASRLYTAFGLVLYPHRFKRPVYD